MADPMKIRAHLKDGVADIRILIRHPNDTGLQKDPETGKTIPEHYIQTLTVDVAGRRVVQGQTHIALARNPVFLFKVARVKAGDLVTVTWHDNLGETRTDEAAILEA
jgi:sulfur-oxidizing protein SoxZ